MPPDDNAMFITTTPPTVKQLYSGEEVEKIVKERDEYKHRAEVAERAFKELCIDKIFGQNDEPSIKWTWDFYKARAEKELAEEEE